MDFTFIMLLLCDMTLVWYGFVESVFVVDAGETSTDSPETREHRTGYVFISHR